MPDSQLNESERTRQQSFISVTALLLVLVLIWALRSDIRDEDPDRRPQPERLAAVTFHPLEFEQPRNASIRIAGAWQVEVDNRRFFGLSGLVARPDRLIALTDSSVLIELPRPGTTGLARLNDLPAGPGYPTFRHNRDSEALLLDQGGAWITFENRHSLWRFGRDGSVRAMGLPAREWPVNQGVEAMVAEPGTGALLLIPEGGEQLLRYPRASTSQRFALAGATGGIADATLLPDGRIVVAVREIGVGLTNRLAWLTKSSAGYRLEPFATLPLGTLDNVEGLAAEPLPSGGTRLWAVTDNDNWRRTLLIALDLPPRGKPPAT